MKFHFDQPPALEKDIIPSPDEIRGIVYKASNIEDELKWEDAHAKIEKIKDLLKEYFTEEDLHQSPYWHAFAMSSIKTDSEVIESETQREIKKKIIEYVTEYLSPLVLENVRPEYSSSLLTSIDAFRKEIAENKVLSVSFQEKLQQAVREVCTEFPGYRVSKIPELDRAVGGSEAHMPDVPEDVVGRALISFAAKYRSIVEDFIEKSPIA